MERPPHIYTIESKPNAQNIPDHSERRLDMLDVSKPHDKINRNEALAEAQNELVGNAAMYENLLIALKKKENGNVSGFAHIENLFVEYAENLSDDEIDSIVRQFNTGFKKYIMSRRGAIDVTPKQFEKITRGEIDIRSNGIKSVVNFIRGRKAILNLSPAQSYDFYFETGLDAHYKIDLVEMIYGEDESIETMSLIQIKSSIPPEYEQEEITKTHREWIDSAVMGIEDLESEYLYGLAEGIPIEHMTGNISEVLEVLEDLCTDPAGFNPDLFLSRLGLDDLNNKQKAWLLKKYLKILEEEINIGISEGYVGNEDAEMIISKLRETETKLVTKTRLPRNLSFIHNIDSVIAVGKNEIKRITLVSKQSDTNKSKIIKYDTIN